MTKASFQKIKFVTVVLATALTVFGISTSVRADDSSQSDSSSQTDPRLAELERQFNELKLRADIAEQQQALIRNSLPQASEASEALEGSTTIQQGPSTIESRILAYQALDEIAEHLAEEFAQIDDVQSIVVFDEQTFKDVALYQAYYYYYDALINQYKYELGLQSPNFTALEVPTTILRSAIDFLALFRTDTSINSFELTLEEPALIAQFASNLQSSLPEVRVSYPGAYASTTSDVILNQLQELLKLRNEVDAEIKEIARIRAAFLSRNRREAPPVDPREARLIELNEKTDSFLEAIFGSSTLSSTLPILVRGQYIAENLVSGEGNYITRFYISGGGSNRTTRNLFLGSRLRHSGGAIVDYFVFKPNGEVILSDSLYYHTGYVRMTHDEPTMNFEP